jgi:hypothetical protein
MPTSLAKTRARSVRWPCLALTALLACGAAGCASVSPSSSTVAPVAGATSSSPSAPPKVPVIHIPTAAASTAKTSKAPAARAAASDATQAEVHPAGTSVPVGNSPLSDDLGSLLVDESGTQLASWNQTSSYCPTTPTIIGNGTVGTDSSGDVTLTTTGKAGSCVALISPGTYSSDVIEADLYFPALPGKPGTLANWTAFWLTDSSAWPADGELDAVEVEPVDATNAVTWHSGTSAAQFTASTSVYSDVRLPEDGANLTPGWHTVDLVYTKGYFAVYYDGEEFTSYTSSNVTGDPLNLYITMVATPATSAVEAEIGSPPINTDSSPATFTVRSLKVWSLR